MPEEKDIKIPVEGSIVKNKETDERYIVREISQRSEIKGFRITLRKPDHQNHEYLEKNVGHLELQDRYYIIEYEGFY